MDLALPYDPLVLRRCAGLCASAAVHDHDRRRLEAMHAQDSARRALGDGAAALPLPDEPPITETSLSLPVRRKSVTWQGSGNDVYTAPPTEGRAGGGGGNGPGRAAEAKATVRVNRHGSIFIDHAERASSLPLPPPPGPAPTERYYSEVGAGAFAAAAAESDDDGDDDDDLAHNIYGSALTPPTLTLGRTELIHQQAC